MKFKNREIIQMKKSMKFPEIYWHLLFQELLKQTKMNLLLKSRQIVQVITHHLAIKTYIQMIHKGIIKEEL